MQRELQILKKLVEESENIVFFGGAGVSTESGIPDFRSDTGLYSQKYKYPPEEMLSHKFFMSNTDDFYDFYKNKMLYLEAKPGKAHTAIAELEKRGKLKAVVTQNVDGLHQAAGSVNVLELHGSVLRNYCMSCKQFYNIDAVTDSKGTPVCGKCGGTIKPDVVLYGENLPQAVIEKAWNAIRKADMLIVGGTSLAVYPAAGLVDLYRGDKLVLINKSPTSMDWKADLIVRGSIGEALSYAIS